MTWTWVYIKSYYSSFEFPPLGDEYSIFLFYSILFYAIYIHDAVNIFIYLMLWIASKFILGCDGPSQGKRKIYEDTQIVNKTRVCACVCLFSFHQVKLTFCLGTRTVHCAASLQSDWGSRLPGVLKLWLLFWQNCGHSQEQGEGKVLLSDRCPLSLHLSFLHFPLQLSCTSQRFVCWTAPRIIRDKTSHIHSWQYLTPCWDVQSALINHLISQKWHKKALHYLI